MEHSDRLQIPCSITGITSLSLSQQSASPSSQNVVQSQINCAQNFETERGSTEGVQRKTIDCLICGKDTVCSQMPVLKEEGEWLDAFCDLFNMDFLDLEVLDIIHDSYYCDGCQRHLRSIAKLKMDLQNIKTSCERLIKEANSVQSNLDSVSSSFLDNEFENQRAKRDKLFQSISHNQEVTIRLKETDQTVADTCTSSSSSIECQNETRETPQLFVQTVSEVIENPEPEPEFRDFVEIASDAVDDAPFDLDYSYSSGQSEEDDDSCDDGQQIGDRPGPLSSKLRRKGPYNKSDSQLRNVQASMKAIASRISINRKTDEKLPAASVTSKEKNCASSHNQIARYQPTILSDRNKAENEALQKKYKEVIAKYGVKNFVIPVRRIPDLESEDVDDELEGRRRQCPIVDCSTLFFKTFKLIEHIKVVHQGMKHAYECKTCGKKFSRRPDFTDHVNTHTGLKPYECEHCHTRFALQKSLKGHLHNIHGEKRFQCDQCGKSYHSKYPYELHLQAHSGERPCTCEVCGKSFKQMYDLRIHQTLHPEFNLDPLKCELCGKVFASSYGLKIHTKVHKGDLPFQCDLCDYKAPYLGRLTTHKLHQHGSQDFKCDTCNRTYKSEFVLNHHKKHWCMKEPNALTCAECGKGFKNILTLRRHEKIHNGTRKTFLCSACGKGFSSKANLQRHVIHSHRDQGGQPKDCDVNVNTNNSNSNLIPSHSWVPSLSFYNDLI